MERKQKQETPGSAIGLYICAGMMALLFLLSIVGIAIGGQDGTRPFFVAAALVTALALIGCILVARALQKKRASKQPKFASYAFEGEFAPQKKKVVLPADKMPKKR